MAPATMSTHSFWIRQLNGSTNRLLHGKEAFDCTRNDGSTGRGATWLAKKLGSISADTSKGHRIRPQAAETPKDYQRFLLKEDADAGSMNVVILAVPC